MNKKKTKQHTNSLETSPQNLSLHQLLSFWKWVGGESSSCNLKQRQLAFLRCGMSDSILQRRGLGVRLSVFIWQLRCSWITWNELYDTYRYLFSYNYFDYHYHCHYVNVWYILIISTSLLSYLHVHSKHWLPRWLCLGFRNCENITKKYAIIIHARWN